MRSKHFYQKKNYKNSEVEISWKNKNKLRTF